MTNTEKRCCPACDAAKPIHLGNKNGFEILVCRKCRTIHTGVLPEAENRENYDDYYSEANLSVPDFIVERVNEIVGEFASYRQTNRFLDVGFGAGTVLEAAAGQGWQTFGIEVSKPAVQQAQNRGFEAFHGTLANAEFPDDHFDVITASEILEHLSSPHHELKEIVRILRPGGILWATTPSARGISFRVMKLGWSAVSPPEHMQLFSRKGVSQMLRRAGLSDIVIHAFGVNPGEIINHLRLSKNELKQFDRVETAYALNQALMQSPLRKRLKAAANKTLSLFSLGDSLKIYARKPQ